ncbi:bifunctional GNAT family N-acetyltransferase/class I SAM-dependent methyltransferase [Anaerosalibacter massiliensis]|uniref:bifunctional GNAT family N-acetyltransferase/class I SAM-dependent methyltransferase n=1 Tax=Anaerosalibacter massiliensis TaxID=1347392 RepID=UPI00164DA2C3|nr:bifunctional GNAT family N-acetyltransferase/class I SAM-dependent methyltransferase [Anaerosalibacter massiliensis]
MTDKIIIKKIKSEEELAEFWKMRDQYMLQDIIPNDELGEPITKEDEEWFFSDEYRSDMNKLFQRKQDTVFPLFFIKDDIIIGFVSYCTYLSEDGECFIIDFCILPEYRNKGLGTKIFYEFSKREIRRGARYFVLNISNNRNKNFWKKQGFQIDGQDEYGSILMRKNISESQYAELLSSTGFDLWSENYDKDVEISDKNNQYPFASYEEVLNTVYNKVCKHKGVVLDIGFGTGVLTKRLYDDGNKIYGIDFSEKMVEISQKKMPEAKLIQFDFKKGLPKELDGVIFDSVISTYAIHHLTDSQKISLIHMILRNLKDSGIIVFGDVSFVNKSEILIAKEKDSDLWDDTEHYLIADQMAKLLPDLKVNFKKLSYCSGVLTINK